VQLNCNEISPLWRTWSPGLTDRILKNQQVAVAISGGLDSTVLLWNFWHFAKFHSSLDFFCLHVNFGLRGSESEADEQFVRQLCRDLKIPLHIKKVPENSAPRTGIQKWARDLRHSWFKEVAHSGALIALAHNQNDLMENAFFRSLRGSPPGAICGMSESDHHLIRPFIHLKRFDIHNWAKHHHVEWREDLSNSKNIYARNLIRNVIFPAMNRASPGSVEAFFSLIRKIDHSPILSIKEFSIMLAPGAGIEIPLSNQFFINFFNSGKSLFFVQTSEVEANECSVIIEQSGIHYHSANEHVSINWAEIADNKLPVGDLLIWKRP
jgi:tRNA(Ile)-lysidine synthetase-like protein